MATRTRIALFFTALALLLPSSALAAGWTGFATLPTTGTAISGLKFASDANGNQVAIWVQAPSPFKVLASVRPAGGAWTAPQTLDATATTTPQLDLAVDPSGNFIAFYSEVVGTTNKIFSAYLPAGQTSFGSSQLFTTVVGGPTFVGLTTAMGSTGTAWGVASFSTSIVAGSRPIGPGSAWTPHSTGLLAGSGGQIDLAVTTDGTPTLADTPAAGGTTRHTRWDGAKWVQLTTPGPGTNSTGAMLIKPDVSNQTTTAFGISNTQTQLGVQSCPAGIPATCAAVKTYGDGKNTPALNPSLSVNPTTGDAFLAWTESPSVMVARRTGALGTWSAVGTSIGSGTLPATAFDSTGGIATLFRNTSNGIQFLSAPAGGALTPPGIAVTDPALAWTTPALATDSSGNVYGAWVSTRLSEAQTAVYDAVPPSTPVITGATSATAGDALTFAASATDTWGVQSYSWDFGDGSTDTGASVTHTYSSPGDYVARVTATDTAGNQSVQNQIVAIAAQPQPQTTSPLPRVLARPIAGQNVNLEPVGGTVLVEVPGSTAFVPLVEPQQVRDGSIIDARNGRVRITIDNGKGGFDTAEFFGGIFQFFQPKVKKGQTWFANLYLYGGNFKGCPAAPKNPKIAQLSRKAKKKAGAGKSVRHLWGDGHGAFRTVGRFSSATVRGTTWLTDDRCDGTLTKVTNGLIGVRDFVLQKTVVVRKGKQYLAQPKAKSAKKAKTQSKKR